MNASEFRYYLKANKVILLMGDAPIRNAFNSVDGNPLRDMEAMRKVAIHYRQRHSLRLERRAVGLEKIKF